MIKIFIAIILVPSVGLCFQTHNQEDHNKSKNRYLEYLDTLSLFKFIKTEDTEVLFNPLNRSLKKVEPYAIYLYELTGHSATFGYGGLIEVSDEDINNWHLWYLKYGDLLYIDTTKYLTGGLSLRGINDSIYYQNIIKEIMERRKILKKIALFFNIKTIKELQENICFSAKILCYPDQKEGKWFRHYIDSSIPEKSCKDEAIQIQFFRPLDTKVILMIRSPNYSDLDKEYLHLVFLFDEKKISSLEVREIKYNKCYNSYYLKTNPCPR